MKEERVKKLYEQVDWISANFKDIKTKTYLDFERVIKVQPLSDSGAIAIFEKKSDSKQAVCFFLWLEREGEFKWWFPSDSDLLFMVRAQHYREIAEGANALVITGRFF